MITIEVTDNAKSELKKIAKFIAQDHPIRAKSYTKEILTKARKLLQTFPESCSLHNEEFNIRKYPYQKYNVYYQYNSAKETVYILHVYHSSVILNEILKTKFI